MRYRWLSLSPTISLTLVLTYVLTYSESTEVGSPPEGRTWKPLYVADGSVAPSSSSRLSATPTKHASYVQIEGMLGVESEKRKLKGQTEKGCQRVLPLL